MKNILFRAEKDIDKEKNYNYLSRSDIKSVNFMFDSMDLHHNIIMGSRGVGKTDKVLIPLFKEFSKLDKGILFIDFNNECEDRLFEQTDRVIHVFYNKDVNTKNIINALKKGEIVYFNVRANKDNDIENLNKIFRMLKHKESELNKNVLILIENIQFMKRCDDFIELFKESNSKILVTFLLQYTRQLLDQYSEEEMECVKEISTSYDVEKQLR